MFEISVTEHFSAAHHLRGYGGKCARPHGHNWQVRLSLRGEKTDRLGMLLDFRRVKEVLREVLEGLDHADLNRHPAFRRQNPTSENLAHYLHGALSRKLRRGKCRVSRVAVRETPSTEAAYWEDES